MNDSLHKKKKEQKSYSSKYASKLMIVIKILKFFIGRIKDYGGHRRAANDEDSAGTIGEEETVR